MLLLIPGNLFVLNPSWEILILISYLLAFIAPLECGIYADFLWSLSFFCFKNNLFGILCYFYSYLSRSNTSRDGKLGNRTRSCTIIRVDHSASFNTKQFVNFFAYATSLKVKRKSTTCCTYSNHSIITITIIMI